MCKAEKDVKRCKDRYARKYLRHDYKRVQHEFDREFRKQKKKFKHEQMLELDEVCTNNPNQFWESVKRFGPKKKAHIPMEVYNQDKTINCNKEDVLTFWQGEFDKLYNSSVTDERDLAFDNYIKEYIRMKETNMKDPLFTSSDMLNRNISEKEVLDVISRLKCKKAIGHDKIPNEVLKCKVLIPLLQQLFQFIFDTGVVPSEWYKTIVTPIHKSAESDTRIPNNYRGISLVSCVSKLFTAILANRVSAHGEDNDVFVDEQGGFRKKRSCTDQAYILHSLIANNIQSGNNIYSCFIDLKKAFDCVDRNMLLYKLLESGIDGKMYYIIKTLYDPKCTESCIRVNEFITEWFYTRQGVKQGDSLSPVLFLIFVNDLAKELTRMNKGIDVNGKRVPILMYADDIVLLSDNEDDLQSMLCHIETWCKKWLMKVNLDKTKIVHFRKQNRERSDYKFMFDNQIVQYTEVYKYLGIYFDEFLQFKCNEDELAKSGSRALGSIICKLKQNECMGYETYTKCCTSCVDPILTYSSEITGYTKGIRLAQIQDRAARSFLGLHKFSPKAAVKAEVGWIDLQVKRKISMLRYWNKLLQMPDSRLVRQVFEKDYAESGQLKNWCYHVRDIFIDIDMVDTFYDKDICNLDYCKEKLISIHENKLYEEIRTKRKLRLYKQIKKDCKVEKYVTFNLTQSQRSLLCQLRIGILPLRVETGRYINLKVDERICEQCDLGTVEDELHFLFHCKLYEEEREYFYRDLDEYNILHMTDVNKLQYCCEEKPRALAKYISKIFEKRKTTQYK